MHKFKSAVWRYYFFSFLRSLHFSGAVLVPFFTIWGGITKTEMQLLQSWFMLWIFILEVPTGAVADYFGRRISIVIGALITAVAAVLYGSVPSLPIFFLAEFMFAAGIAFSSGADSALLYDVLKEEGREEESKDIFAKSHAISLGGLLISSILGAVIYRFLGLNAPMYLTALPLVIAAYIMWGMPEARASSEPREKTRYLDVVKKGFVFLYRHKKLQAIALDGILVAAGAYFVIWLYQQLLENIGVPIAYFGIIHALLVSSEIVVSSQFVRLEKLLGSAKRYLSVSALITGVSFIAVALFPHPIVIGLFIIAAAGFGLTRIELMNAYMNKFIPSAQRATVLSSISMFRRFALVLLNPIVGAAADFSLPLALIIAGLLPLSVFFFSPVEKNSLEDE